MTGSPHGVASQCVCVLCNLKGVLFRLPVVVIIYLRPYPKVTSHQLSELMVLPFFFCSGLSTPACLPESDCDKNQIINKILKMRRHNASVRLRAGKLLTSFLMLEVMYVLLRTALSLINGCLRTILRL